MMEELHHTLSEDERDFVQGWPASAIEVAEVIGVMTALRLIEAFRGAELYIPHRMTEDHHIALIIGFSAASRLSQWRPGDKLDISTLPVGIQKKRAIMQAIAQGDGTTDEIARRFQVTNRWVRYCKSCLSGKDDPRQIEMSCFPKMPPPERNRR